MTGEKKVFLIQLSVGLAAVIIAAMLGELYSALYGLGIGLVNLVLLHQGFAIANRRAVENPKSGMTVLYLSAVVRFILLAVFFALGLALLGLNPGPMVLTFVAMQLASVFNLQGKRRLTD